MLFVFSPPFCPPRLLDRAVNVSHEGRDTRIAEAMARSQLLFDRALLRRCSVRTPTPWHVARYTPTRVKTHDIANPSGKVSYIVTAKRNTRGEHIWSSQEATHSPLRICPRSIMSWFPTTRPASTSTLPVIHDQMGLYIHEKLE